MISRVVEAFRRFVPSSLRPKHGELRSREGLVSQTALEILEVPLAGVMHLGRGENVLGLRLWDRVQLVREPKNAFDTNAIAVLAPGGARVGYVPRGLAEDLAAWLDATGKPPAAIVTRLVTDATGMAFGVTVAFQVGREIAVEAPGLIEFTVDRGNAGALYILLNCGSGMLNEVETGLDGAGLRVERVGQAYRPASDGRLYSWYIRMGEGVSEERVLEHFSNVHGIAPWGAVAAAELDGYIAMADSEIAAKDEAIASLKAQLEEAVDETREAKRQQRRASGQALRELVEAILPDIQFLGDSWDVISMELQQPERVLRELHSVCCRPGEIRAVQVKTAPDWRELHFNTGQRDDGRLYFRREGRTVLALVAFKKTQERDIEYLRTM